MLGQDLAYVALVSKDVERACRLLGHHLGLGRSDLDDGMGGRLPVFSVGDSALAIYPLGHPGVAGETRTGVHHIALAVPDLSSGVTAAESAGVPIAGAPHKALGGRNRIALDAAATAGVKTFLTEQIAIDRGRTPLIQRLDHLGIASADNKAAIAVWNGQLNRPIESQQTDIETTIPVESFTSDTHGVVYHTRSPVVVGGLRVAFITVGDTDLEFLQDLDPRHPGRVDHGTAGTTRQDQGAIAKFVATRGQGLHHIAMKTPDIDAVLSGLDKAGVPVIDRKGRPGSRAGLIGFLHPQAMGGILLHFDERAA
jgi:catechol 2,3-dioxygenase-like lactoylglutathione lyase family enzyme